MTIFIRAIAEFDKKAALEKAVSSVRTGSLTDGVFHLDSEKFLELPGSPFPYWTSAAVRDSFRRYRQFETGDRAVKQGLATADDFRFVRLNWEVSRHGDDWVPYAKGGSSKPFLQEVYCLVRWAKDGAEIKNNLNERGGIRSNVWMLGETERLYFRKSGLTWPLRGYRFTAQAVPPGCIFSVAGKMAFPKESEQIAALALFNSTAFDTFVMMLAGRVVGAQYEVGLIQKIPYPSVPVEAQRTLGDLARAGWTARYRDLSFDELSSAFLLPRGLHERSGTQSTSQRPNELESILSAIDDVAFGLYEFNDADRAAVLVGQGVVKTGGNEGDESGDTEDESDPIDTATGLLSWAVGVAFGRFDLRVATGERQAPLDPDSFDPLPGKSPGMLPEGAAPFHAHAGALVDDAGHSQDLARLAEDVLIRVNAPVPGDLRRSLQKDFFPLHLQRYSKSRRKAPIYWPLATASGRYTLWLYYPSLSSQTLFTAINDLLDGPKGKLTQVAGDLAALRSMGSARTRDEETRFETLESLDMELIELRDQLLNIAPTYKPNHDDGVQITAAPLWQLFRHKPWQKILRDTWAKLEKGDYDWAHLAMNYWPDRVREKCKSDKSLAIAHGLEHLYVEPTAKPKKARGRKAASGDDE